MVPVVHAVVGRQQGGCRGSGAAGEGIGRDNRRGAGKGSGQNREDREVELHIGASSFSVVNQLPLAGYASLPAQLLQV
jgi:hypothetical protein